MMKLLVPVLGACLAVSTPAAAATDDAAKLAEAKAIIEVILPTADREQMMDKMMTSLSAPMRQSLPIANVADPGLKALVNGFLDEIEQHQRPLMRKHMPMMMEAMAGAYTREFSLAELKDIHAFAQTPSGRRYFSRSTAIVSDPAVTKANADLFAEAQTLMATIMPPFKEKLIAYLKEHPEVAEKLAAQGHPK